LTAVNKPFSLALALAAAILPACGFHLAGEGSTLPAPMSSVYIDMVDPYHVTVPPLETALQEKIKARGGLVKSSSEQARSVLRLSSLSETRETLSVGPDGKAIEYRLVDSVNYELRSGDQQLISPQAQGISRDYSFSVDEILAKEQEESRLRNYMQAELAELILLRIEAELSHPAKAADAVTPAGAPAGAAGAAPPS
jgi:LPS-assembly lipoprotein